jgi:DNA-binding transcriptional MocR family regulator
MQRAVSAFMDRGGYEKHLRNVRDHYRHTLRRMRQTVVEGFPRQTRVMRPNGGFLLWVELPDGIDAAVLARKALEQGVSVAPGMLFSPSNAFDHGLRLNGGRLWSETIQSSLETLGELIQEMCDGLKHA